MEFKGTILDENHYPLPLVNVYVTDAGTGNSTDENGFFVIDSDKVNPFSRVIISFVGYNDVVATVGELNYKTIVLEPSQTQLDEAIVYGSKNTDYSWIWKGILTFATIKVFTYKGAKKVTI